MLRRHHSEQGIALLSAIALMVVGILVIGGIMVSVASMRDRARDDVDQSLGAGPAEDGVRAYVAALSAGSIGEHTGFSFTRAALLQTVREVDPSAGDCRGAADRLCLVQNARTAFPRVDDRLVPQADRYAVRQRAGNGTYRFWQVVAVSPPRFGAVDATGQPVSPGGAPVVYIRGWQGRATPRATDRIRPVLLAARVRPASFSDYQLLTDGKLYLADGVNVNGRIHTNGIDQSFFDQYASLNNAITVSGSTCTATASLSSARGTIGAPNVAGSPIAGSCGQASKLFPNSGEHLSLLRTTETGRLARSLCGRSRSLDVRCFDTASASASYRVRLNGNGTINVSGAANATVDARNLSLARPFDRAGAVLVFDRTVFVSGQLGNGARATIYAINLQSETVAETPSIRIDASQAGAASGSTNAVGFVAEGDVIADEARACPVRIRAAMVAQGGMFSLNPRFRGAAIPGATVCSRQNPALRLDGSITGHLPPYLTVWIISGSSEIPTAGYATRTYEYDPWLYHNPPPLFPASERWQLLSSSTADLNCFDPNGALRNQPGCR